MNKQQFCTGDRAIVLENELYPMLAGFIGTVREWRLTSVGVEFDRDAPSADYPFHDLGGVIRDNRGWYVPWEYLAHYEEDTQLSPVNTDALFN